MPDVVQPLPTMLPIREGEDVATMGAIGGAVRTLSAGTRVIRSVHNGPAQVAQVVVCHALRAAL